MQETNLYFKALTYPSGGLHLGWEFGISASVLGALVQAFPCAHAFLDQF